METTEDGREQGTLVKLDKKRREDSEERVTEEEIIVVERDARGKLIRKKEKPRKEELKRSESEESELIEEIEVKKKRKALKPQRPRTGEDDIELEELEELETIRDEAVPSMRPLNVPSQSNEVVALTRSVDQAPGRPESDRAKITLDTVNALTEEYRSVQESEIDHVLKVKPDSGKAQMTISPVEPYSTTETTIQASTGEFKDKFKPTAYEATPSVVPKEGVQVSETVPSEAKPSTLSADQPTPSQRAEISVTLREATAVSETQVEQREVPSEDFVKPVSVTAEDSVLPKIGLSVYEVQEGIAEDKLEPLKTIAAKPRVNITPKEPLTIEEVQSEDKPGKYYPELIVPTEVATQSIISQRLLVTEETNAPEKEGEYVPGRLPAGQRAQVGVSEGVEVPEISDQPIQETTGMYIPDRTVDTFEAERKVSLLETVTVSTVDSEHRESNLIAEERKSATAELKVVEKSSVTMTETVTSEKENEYQPEERPSGKLADASIQPLEIGTVSSTLIQESEGLYTEETKPTAVIAETSLRPEEHLMVSQIQTADYPSDFKDDLKYITESGVMSVELAEAKIIQETLTHDREEKIEEAVKPEERTVDASFDSVKGVEIYQTTSVDKEGELKIFEMPESHRGKAVPTHPVMSFQIEETRPEDNLGDLSGLIPTTARAKIGHDNLQETIVDVTITDELVGQVEKDRVPDSKNAEIGIDGIESVRTTEIVVNETEGEYTGVCKVESFFATSGFTTTVAIEQQEVRTESPTGEFVGETPVHGTAQSNQVPLESVCVGLQEIAEKEGVYNEEARPEGKIASVDFTEARPGATVLEVMAHDLENDYSPDTQPQNYTAQSTIDGRTIAMKSETLVEHSAGKMSDETPKTAKAFGTQEAHDELIIVETNIAEAEKPRVEEMKPLEQTAAIEMATTENITITEVVTDQKEDILHLDELAEGRKITMNLTSTHEVAETRETVIANNVDVLAKDFKPKSESATLSQNGLEIVQQIETTTSEKESFLAEDTKPEVKRVDITFAEGQGLQVTMTHSEDKEGPLAEKTQPKSVEALVDFEVQGVATKFEVVGHTGVTDFTPQVPIDAKPQTTLLPYETVIAEEVQTRETEVPLKEVALSDRKAELAFEIGESVVVSTVTVGEREKLLEDTDKPDTKTATFELTSHGVAQASETIPEDGASEFKPEVAQPAIAHTDHVTHKSLITMETSTSDLEGIMTEFVKPEEKMPDVAFEEASLGLSVIQTITSDMEKEYIPTESQTERATTSFDAHRVAELSEVTTSSETGQLISKVPHSFVATKEHVPFESSIIQSQTLVSEKETEFTEKPAVATNTVSVTIGDKGQVTTVTEVTTIEHEGSLGSFEKPEEKMANFDFSGHVIAEKTQVEVDSSTGELEYLKPQSVAAVPSQIPLESVVRMETQVSEAEAPLTEDKKPTEALADLSVVEGQSIQVEMVTMEDKEADYKPKDLPEGKIAAKVLTGGHLVAETVEHVTDSSTKEFMDDKPTPSVAACDQLTFNPLTSSQVLVGESEYQLLPDIKPEDKVALIDIESGRSTVTISEITLSDKESVYLPEILPGEKLATFGIDMTHEIAETTSVVIEHSVGNVERTKFDSVKASPSQEVCSSVIVSEDISQEQEKSFEGTFKPETRDIHVSVEEGKRVTTVEEVTSEDREENFVGEFKPKTREALPELTPGGEVAEKSEVIPSFSTGEVEILKPAKVTAQIGQKPHETVQLTEEFLGEREGERIERKTEMTKARVALDENTSVLVVEMTMTQDLEEELSTPSKPREETAKPAMEGKEVVQQNEITPRDDLAEMTIAKPVRVEAKETQDTFESVGVTEAITQELGQAFDGKFKPDHRMAEVTFVEGKSLTVNQVFAQDKEGSVTLARRTESVAEVTVTRVGQDIAEKTQIFVDQSVGSVEPFESDKRKAHPRQDAFEPIIIEEVPPGESEKSFVDYPKSVSTTAEEKFEEGYGVTITEVTSGEVESTLEEQKVIESRTAESSLVIERSTVETTAVESQMDVQTKPEELEFDKQVAISSQDIFEGITVSENLVKESEQLFEGAFKPTTQKAIVDVQGATSVQVSEVTSEDREESFEGKPKAPGVRAREEYNLYETAERSETEAVQSIGEITEEKRVTSQATLSQTMMESVVETVMTTGEREDKFEGSFTPEMQKGTPQMDGLSTVTIEEIVSTETENILEDAEKPKDRRAQPNISGREVAQTTEIETIAAAQEFDKFAGPATQKGKPQFDEMTSIIVSHTVSNETEQILQSPEIPKEKSVRPNLDGREIAETTSVETISTVEEFAKPKGPESQKGVPALEEHSSVTVSHVVSNETEQEMPSPEVPGAKTAQPSLLGREIAQTSHVVAMSSEGYIVDTASPEERRGQPALEELSSIIVFQTVSNEAEELLLGGEAPSSKKAEQSMSGRDIAETTQVLTLASFQDLVDDTKPEEQQGKRELEEHSSITVSQIISHEAEDTLPSPEVPKGKTAQPQFSSREIAESSQVTPLTSVEDFAATKSPEKQRGKPYHDEMSSLIVLQTVSNEAEVTLPSATLPNQVTAKPNLLGRETVETTEVTTVTNAEELVAPAVPEEQKGQPHVNELTSLIVSQAVSNESEQLLPAPEVPSVKTATPNLSGREIAETSEVMTVHNTEEFVRMKKPEEQRGKAQLDELTSLIVSQTVSNEIEENLRSVQVPDEATAKANLLGRETAQTIQVTTLTNAEDLAAFAAPEEQKIKPRRDELKSLIVSQAVYNETEELLPSPEVPTVKTAIPSLSGREIAETNEITTVSSTNEFVREKHPEEQRGVPQLDGLTSVIVSQTVFNEHEEELPGQQMPGEKIAQPLLSGRDVAETLQVLTLTSSGEFISDKKPEPQEGKQNFEEFSSLAVSQVILNDQEGSMPTADVPSESTAHPKLSGREAVVTLQITTLTNTEELLRPKAPEEHTGKAMLDELSSLSVSQIQTNEAEGVLPSLEVPTGRKAQPNLFSHEIAEKSDVVTVTMAENMPESEKTESQRGTTEIEEMSTVTVSEVISNETETDMPIEEKPKTYKALSHVSSIEVIETTEILTAMNTQDLPDQAAPDTQRGRPNLEELASVFVSEITHGETENILVSPEEPIKQIADTNLWGRQVAEKSQVLTSTTTQDLPEGQKPESKKIIPEQIPYESFEQSIQQLQESETTLVVKKSAVSGQADIVFQTSESIRISEVTNFEKESKEVIKGKADEVKAQPDVVDRGVATKQEILSESVASEFNVEKPETKRARAVDDEKRGVLVTELRVTGEQESELPESVKPIAKTAYVSIESDHLKRVIVGEYNTLWGYIRLFILFLS